MTVTELQLEPPFKPIVHNWEQIKSHVALARDSVKTLEERVEFNDIAQLGRILNDAISPSLFTLRTIMLTKQVEFDSLWLIFAPGQLIYSKHTGAEQLYRLRSFTLGQTMGEPPKWMVGLEYLDWNGRVTGFSATDTSISNYSGSKALNSLECVPLKWHWNSEEIVNRLTSRGRKFSALRGYHFKFCEGNLKITYNRVKPVFKPVKGRVIIDALAYYRCQEIGSSKLGSLTAKIKDYEEEEGLDDTEDFQRQDEGADDRTQDLVSLTDEQCALANARVKGMYLKSKEWGEFLVDDLEDVEWNKNTFQKLVLLGGEKDMALAVCKHKTKLSLDIDFVTGKGRGLILLLFGPPGVGKTFTAEAVAEELRVPLYSMTAGDLGTTPIEVEVALDRVFLCCGLWNAILLLDEADVFLRARTSGGLERNDLVSIFLRKMEHYHGILFLTTNRMTAIDSAFQSRIDFIIPYSELTPGARKMVWNNFISRVGPEHFDFTDNDIDKLAKFNVNGREIKNLIKTSLLLASDDNSKVTISHLERLTAMRLKAQTIGFG